MTMPGHIESRDEDEKGSKIDVEDHSCPICMYVLIEPVTLPCDHELCLSCFQQNVQESLCCPMCRCRISSWVRRQARLNNLVNQKRWKQIKTLFPEKVRLRQEGYEEEDDTDEEFHPPAPRLSKPGEIREEYERALRRLNEERDAERRREEEASAALLRTLLKEDQQLKEETERLESQLKKDEELARLLETVGTPALSREGETETTNSNGQNMHVLPGIPENETAENSNNDNADLSSTPHESSSSVSIPNIPNNNKRKASPTSPNQSKLARLINASPRHPIRRKSSEAPVRSPSSVSGSGHKQEKKPISKLSIVDHFKKYSHLNPNGVSSSRTDDFTPTPKKTLLNETLNDSNNDPPQGSSNMVGGRKILFEKKLNLEKSDSKNSKSRLKGNIKSSPSSPKLDIFFKQKEKSVCDAYMGGEASQTSTEEEKDRLFALALQEQYDMELKMSREVNRAKGTLDEYKLRQKSVNYNKRQRREK